MATFRKLVVWQRAFTLCIGVYGLTDNFPIQERYGLVAELRKTARSVVYNIAEGHRRASAKDFARFLAIAHGSAAELETQFLISESLGYLQIGDTAKLLSQLDEICRMLVGLKASLKFSG